MKTEIKPQESHIQIITIVYSFGYFNENFEIKVIPFQKVEIEMRNYRRSLKKVN